MALNDVYRMALVGVGSAGQQLVNVHHYQQVAGTGSDEGLQLIDAWVAQASASWADCVGVDNLMTQIQIRNITQPEKGMDYSLPTPIPGEMTGEGLPPQTAGIISWRTGLIGRRRRGRTFMFPAGESAQNNGQWNSGHLSNLNDYGLIMLELDSAGTSYQMVIYSAPDTTPPPSPAVLVTPVTGVVIPIYTASQRRRRVGVGS